MLLERLAIDLIRQCSTVWARVGLPRLHRSPPRARLWSLAWASRGLSGAADQRLVNVPCEPVRCVDAEQLVQREWLALAQRARSRETPQGRD